MKNYILWIVFTGLSSCSYPLIHKIADQQSLTLKPMFVELRASQENILALLGDPSYRDIDPFHREEWIYPLSFTQSTYSNESKRGWYLFAAKASSAPTHLVLQFDSEGKLECLLTKNSAKPKSMDSL